MGLALCFNWSEAQRGVTTCLHLHRHPFGSGRNPNRASNGFSMPISPHSHRERLLRPHFRPLSPSLPASPGDTGKPRRLPGPSKESHAGSVLSHGHRAGRLARREGETPTAGEQSHRAPLTEEPVEMSTRRAPFTRKPAGRGAQSPDGDAKRSSGPSRYF